MEQPIEQRFTKLENRVSDLERLEKKLDFVARDISYKTDLAQGMMKQLHEDNYEIKTTMQQMKTDMQDMKTDMQQMNGKLDQILTLLNPQGNP